MILNDEISQRRLEIKSNLQITKILSYINSL